MVPRPPSDVKTFSGVFQRQASHYSRPVARALCQNFVYMYFQQHILLPPFKKVFYSFQAGTVNFFHKFASMQEMCV